MASRYLEIWQKIKKDKQATVRCKVASMQTLIQAVKKVKSKEESPRKMLELPAFGKLKIKRKVGETFALVEFSIVPWNRAEDL